MYVYVYIYIRVCVCDCVYLLIKRYISVLCLVKSWLEKLPIKRASEVHVGIYVCVYAYEACILHMGVCFVYRRRGPRL